MLFFSWALLGPLSDLYSLLICWRFSIPFIINQTASILFQWLVARFPISVVVPATNGIQLVATAFVGHLLGDRLLSRNSLLGVSIILTGLGLMYVAEN